MADFPQIPGYRLERELGRGGMARVYLALEEKLERHVALKVLLRSLTEDEDVTRRFLKEAKTAAKLRHSHIVAIHDVGRMGDVYYFSMEYLEENLRQRIRRGALGAGEALVVLRQIAGALDYAHSEGLIHRDIKPENIMFRRDGSAVLADFGIAKAAGSGTRLTATGMSIGTPHYMSPEQIRGLELDGRADIYSLGVVLHEMLTGKVPYDATDTIAIAMKHVQEPLPDLPPHLRRYQPLLNRMMAKGREARLQSGAEVVRLVQELEESGMRQPGTSQAAGRASAGPAGRPAEDRPSKGSKKQTPVGIPDIDRSEGAGGDRPERGIFQYGTAEESPKSPNRTRNILIGVLGGALVVAVGLLIVLLSKGDRESGVGSAVPSTRGGGAVEERTGPGPESPGRQSGAGVKSTYEEERETRFADYLAKAEKYYESGDYERARRNAELAAAVKRTAELGALERSIASSLELQAAQRAEQERMKQRTEQPQDTARADDAAWGMASGLGTEEAYNRYLASYPSGRHAAEARQKIAGFQAAERAKAEEAERQKRAEEERRRAEPTAGQTWRDSVTGMEFVWIPAGEFEMGSNSREAYSDEKPVHRVFVDGFWMGKHEVTQGEWQAVMGSNPSGFKKGDNYPVEQVSWEDVQEFIRRLNSRSGQVFRLPTEAEWEYACRSGTTGDRYGNLDDIAWYGQNSGPSTHPVGQKRANSFGLYDMLGNVWEWCQDWYGSYSAGYVRNPSGPSAGSYRVDRGGSWDGNARYVRSASRVNFAPSFRYYFLGFRLARTK